MFKLVWGIVGFPSLLTYICLFVAIVHDSGAQMWAEVVHTISSDSVAYLLLIGRYVIAVFIEMSVGRLSMLYGIQAQVLLGKLLLRKMLAVFCDGTASIGQDADTILRCDARFNYLMRTAMHGQSLLGHIFASESGHEREHVKHAFNSAPKDPMLISNALIDNNMSPHAIELAIVHHGSMTPSQWPTCLFGCLVDIQSCSAATHEADGFNSEEFAGWKRVDTQDHADAACCDNPSGLSRPATIHTGEVFYEYAQSSRGITGKWEAGWPN